MNTSLRARSARNRGRRALSGIVVVAQCLAWPNVGGSAAGTCLAACGNLAHQVDLTVATTNALVVFMNGTYGPPISLLLCGQFIDLSP